MRKLFALFTVFALVALMGAGCALSISPEEKPVTVPSEEVPVPTADEIGEVDVVEEGEAESEKSIDELIGEADGLEEEAAGTLNDLQNIDDSQDNKVNL
ncbi:MAG: hypothetical protein PHW53_02700 [Patescibacteria group bacterium]|nr:hypothetical protein [Patescibacteria group bacterium]